MGRTTNVSEAKSIFGFHGIIDMGASQEEVFEVFAKDCVISVLEGFNSTIFAYGQTGSGKTYSITGGTQAYDQRGIIPRCVIYLFNEYEKRVDYMYETRVSFMEIYNGIGRDLLDPVHQVGDEGAYCVSLSSVLCWWVFSHSSAID